MVRRLFKILILSVFFVNVTSFYIALQAEEPSTSKFAVLKSNKVNVHKGPGTNFPILWVVNQIFMPIEILHESDGWLMIKDFSGDIGWIYSANVNYSKREGIIKENNTALCFSPVKDCISIAVLNKLVLIKLLNCGQKWCRVKVNNISGWVNRNKVWGISPTERL